MTRAEHTSAAAAEAASSSNNSYNSNTFVNNNMLSLSAAVRLLYVKHLQHCLTPNMSDCYCLIFAKLFI